MISVQYSLVPQARAVGFLVAERAAPSLVALAGKAGRACHVAGPVDAHLLQTRFAAWQDPHLQRDVPEILQLAVDEEVLEAAVETGSILAWSLVQRSYVFLQGHTWGRMAQVSRTKAGSLKVTDWLQEMSPGFLILFIYLF